jgi:PAS domain S-box-containing protein
MTDQTISVEMAQPAAMRGKRSIDFRGFGQSADPFAAAVRATHTPMVISDPLQHDNPVIFANDAFCQMTGYALAEVLGRNCRFLQGPQTDSATVARIRDAVRDGRAIEVNLRNHRKDGAAFWNRLAITPVRDPDGAIVFFVASQSDVTLELDRVPKLEARNDALIVTLADRLAALEESEARFRHMADNAPVMVWTTDEAGSCTWLSQSWQGFTGQNLAEGLGHGWLTTIHPDDRHRVRTEFRHAYTTTASARIEYRLRRADGRYAWVIDAAAPRIAEDGTAMGYVGSILDITDRRNAEERLALNEESLRLATDAAEIGTWDIDLATNRMKLSERARLIFGVPLDANLWLSDLRARIHPEDRPSRAAAFEAMIDPAIRATYDVDIRTVYQEDGSFRWAALKGKGLFSPDGRCLSAYGTVVDITARKQSEARQTALLAIAERTRKLTDPPSIARAVRDVLGPYFDTDHVGFAAISPQDAASFAGVNVHAEASSLLLGVLTPVMRAHLADGQALICGEPKIGPHAPCPTCKTMGVQTLLVLPLLRDGALAALAYVGQMEQRRWSSGDRTLAELVVARGWDAIERTRAEAALRELNATLESRVEERTAELHNAEESLRQSQKMEAVGQLTGGIAHDFNNLLTGIVGSLDMLQRRLADGRMDGLQRYAGMAVASAQRAGALTQRLLAFARRQPLDPRPTEVNTLISGMADLLRRTLGPAVTLDLVLDDGLWPTLCDANQLESAILNLAINARDAMPAGGRLTIQTANAMLDAAQARAAGDIRAGEYTVIRVTDNGAGMTPDVMARAFEPFFTTKPIGQGTGLGLSMLYGFAKQSEGHVQLASEIGHGTSFRLLLPRHAGAPADIDRMASQAQAVAGSGQGAVLVVDDEHAVRMLVAEALEECGFTVLQAPDGPAALRILQSSAAVDLLVTDVGLPGLNGRQVADAARGLRPGLKVLFITGYAHNAEIGRGALEPGMEMMTKPFALAALAAKVGGMLTPG